MSRSGTATATASPLRGLWGRAERRWPLVLAGLLALAAAIIATALVVQAARAMLPSGGRASLSRADADDVTARSTRSWYDATTADGLAAELAVALDGTEWCAGWSITQANGVAAYGPELVDRGSNRGVDERAQDCPRWVEVEVLYVFTGSNSNSEDNAELWVESSDNRLVSELADHPAFDVTADDLLREDRGTNDSDVIGDAVAALPLALADAGRIDPLTVQPVGEGAAPTQGVEFADREGWGGSDVLRAERTTIATGAIVALLGLAGLCLTLVRLRPRPAAINPRRALKAALSAGRPPPPGAEPSGTPPPPPSRTPDTQETT